MENKVLKSIVIGVAIIVALMVGYLLGENNAIKSANLVDTNAQEGWYVINFNGQEHIYSNDNFER